MLGNIGDLFVICMWQVTEGHLYHLLWVSDYYVMYKQRARSVLCNVSKGHWVTELLDGFMNFCGYREEILTSRLRLEKSNRLLYSPYNLEKGMSGGGIVDLAKDRVRFH